MPLATDRSLVLCFDNHSICVFVDHDRPEQSGVDDHFLLLIYIFDKIRIVTQDCLVCIDLFRISDDLELFTGRVVARCHRLT